MIRWGLRPGVLSRVRGLVVTFVETSVKNPQAIFSMPQRLLVPLFQRPYVWDEERQWAPLWADVVRVTEKTLALDHEARHFLGAVVLQQKANATGTLMTRTIIDGQQRLTTLQLLFDAIRVQLGLLDLENPARTAADLVENPEHYRHDPEDRFKVWPTNRDRDAFVEVLGTSASEHADLVNAQQRIVKAHAFFSHAAQEWLSSEPEGLRERAAALVEAIATRLQLVVIDLKADEDAQEIFETLNARGTPLTAADLIKNLVFQRLDVSANESEKAYFRYWQQFETPFWEKEVSSGRVLWSRSSLFLNQWLTSQTHEDVPAREVFAAFKRYLDDSQVPVAKTLEHIRACAEVYQDLQEGSEDRHKPLSVLERFTYRAAAMQSEVVKPIVIWLTDPELPPVPHDELVKGIGALESWFVRRMLVRENSQGNNRFLVDLLAQLAQVNREEVGTRIVELLAEQTSDVGYWPDDNAVRRSLESLPIYRRMSRARLRMLLEALEDYRRGFTSGGKGAKGEQPVVREECTIEHIMPQKWGQYWPLNDGVSGQDRDALIHTLGNLTLVSGSLNPSLSNGPWDGTQGKRTALISYSSIKLTADAIQRADESGGGWDENVIEERTEAMISDLLSLWPVPEGHHNGGRHGSAGAVEVTIKDLMAAGLIAGGQTLHGSGAHPHAFATVRDDGLIEVDGRPFDSPSGAARMATHRRAMSGWWFWRVGDGSGPRLSELRAQLVVDEPDEVD